MTESVTAANAIGSGGIEKYDPLMGIVSRLKPEGVGKKKRLRDIVGNVKMDLANDSERSNRGNRR